jgi:hypothetical protein
MGLDVEVFVDRLNKALAEAGFKNPYWVEEGCICSHRDFHEAVAPAVVWQAWRVAKGVEEPGPCWSCWYASLQAQESDDIDEIGNMAFDCVTGRKCHFPDGPAFPPREMLIRGR